MRKTALIMMCIMVAALSGCGDFEWFPSGTSGGSFPSPPPPGGSLTDVQADTVTTFDPYTVRFGTISSSTTSTTISVSGDSTSMYTVNGGNPTKAAGTVKKGDVVQVQNTSSNYGANRAISTLLLIGGASATYTSITGNLIFVTRKSAPLNTANYPSGQTMIPVTLPGGFTFPATISLNTDITTSGSNSSIWINGNIQADGYTVIPGMLLELKHTTASTSGSTVISAVTLSPKTGPGIPYTVTFKSVTQ